MAIYHNKERIDLYSGHAEITSITGTDTTDGTITPNDILVGKVGYSQGERYIGLCTFDSDTKDATAAAGDIYVGQTAYINEQKVTGTLEIPADKIIENEVIRDTIGTRRCIDFTEEIENEIPTLIINSGVIVG